MARLIIVFLGLWFGSLSAAAELVKLHDFDVAGWEAAVYGDTETGRFDNCMASGRYEGGVDFHVIVFRDYRWALGFSSSSWNLSTGEIRLGYRFDEGQWFVTEANMESAGGLILWYMADDPTQVTLFRRSRVMDISIAQRTYSFKLTGTARLVSTLSHCVKVVTDAEKGKVAEKPAAQVKSKSKTAAKAKPAAEKKEQVATAEPQAKAPEDDAPRGSSGTGFIISQNGHILTNDHVVQGCRSITISRTGDIPKPVALLRTDVTNDLAVLKMEGTVAADEMARFRTRSMRAGENIAAYGFPLAGTLSASGNIVSGNVTSLAGLSDDVRLLQISAPIQPGNSGGPLMDNTGAVVGIVNGKLNEIAAVKELGTLPQNVNFSIKANVGLNFLDAHSIPYETSGESAAVLDLPAIADKARKFTVFIACTR